MKFYELPSALQSAKNAGDEPVRLKVEIDFGGHFETVFAQDIIEANFFSLKEAAGGISSGGEVFIDNQLNCYSYPNSVGKEVRVSFSFGDDLPYFQRFRFFIDYKGIQDIRGPGRRRCVRIGLEDLSARLRRTDEAKDWSSPAVFAYSVVSDKSQGGKSLVHCIAKRAGLSGCDIDCSTIPVTLPYVRLRNNVWSELSSLATAYRCHLECPVEKPLVFKQSPYANEELGISNEEREKRKEKNEESDNEPYLIKGEDVFYLRKFVRADLYRNSVRLKVNMPVVLDRQEIWRYNEPPVLYDDYIQAHYPFKFPVVREIETGRYDAKYCVIDDSGKEKNVIYADELDTQEEAENRLDYDGGPFCYSLYDVSTNYEKAIVTLAKESDGDLYVASIHGRPIVLDLNRSCFMRDMEAVTQYGTVALNVTGKYFSDYEVNGKPHYEDWVSRELEERLQIRHEYIVKTHRALFNARVGAKIKIEMRKEKREKEDGEKVMSNEQGAMSNVENPLPCGFSTWTNVSHSSAKALETAASMPPKAKEITGVINAFSFRYKRDRAFVASFRILETNSGE